MRFNIDRYNIPDVLYHFSEMGFNVGRYNLTDNTVAPVASYTGDKNFGIVPFTVQFTSTSINEPVVYNWDFGDGTTSNEQNPSHEYLISGSFTVTLLAVNRGGSNTKINEGFVYAISKPPIADFTSDVQTGDIPLIVNFVDNSVNVPANWLWDFGDGSYSTIQNPSHTYQDSGRYTVTLTVSNGGGDDTKSVYNYINATGTPPVADFTTDTIVGYKPALIQFSNTSTSYPIKFEWNFGDTNCGNDITKINDSYPPYHTYDSAEINPSYLYEGVGVFHPTLTVSNNSGSDTISKTVTILDSVPTCSFTQSIEGWKVTTTDTTTGYPTTLIWEWGDGTITTEYRSPNNIDAWNQATKTRSHMYTSPGTYQITLTVSNTAGIDDLDGASFTVDYTIPVAAFTSNTIKGYVPAMAVQFYDQSTEKPTSWLWSFGDGITSTEQNPFHVYENITPTTYTVTLTATSSKGSDTETKSAYISLVSKVGITIVAANDSDPTEKFYADYVCDSSNTNQVTINTAASRGGTVVLLEGTFNCNDNIKATDCVLTGSGINKTIINTSAYVHVSNASDMTVNGGTVKTTVFNPTIYNLSRLNLNTSSIKVELLTTGATITWDTIKVINAIDDGFNVSSLGSTLTLNITNCSAIGCGGNGFNLYNCVNYESIIITDCIADDNYLNGFYFELPPGYNYITDMLVERCVASNNGLRNYVAPSGAGFLFVDKSYYKNYYDKQTQTLSYKPYALIKNCVSQNNATANYASYGYGTNTAPMIVQDCKSVGSKTSVMVDNHNGIIFNRFISDGAIEDILRTYGVSDIEFMDGIVTFTAPNTFNISIPVDTYGLRIVNAPNNIPDVQLNLTNADYNNLSAQLKTIIVMED